MVTVTEDIRYIGVNDRDLDLFEGQYIIPNGIAYNSYVIMDEKIAVMDTVDKRKTAEFLENLERELGDRFVRLHRAYLAAADKIEAVDWKENRVQVGGRTCLLSRTGKQTLRRMLGGGL